jgi:hypothetical protein
MHEQQSGPPPVGYRGPGGFKADLQEKPRSPPSGADPEYVDVPHTPTASYS